MDAHVSAVFSLSFCCEERERESCLIDMSSLVRLPSPLSFSPSPFSHSRELWLFSCSSVSSDAAASAAFVI